MIKTFADKETQNLFNLGKSRKLPPDLIKRAIRRLEYIHYAITLKDLKVPPSNRLHALEGERNDEAVAEQARRHRGGEDAGKSTCGREGARGPPEGTRGHEVGEIIRDR